LAELTTLDQLIVWREWSSSTRHCRFPGARDAKLHSSNIVATTFARP